MKKNSTAFLATAAATALLAAGAGDAAALELRGSMAEGHDRYVPAVSNPVFNESPYITTEARAIYIHQEIPDDFVTGGGDIELVALQLRVALTERLAFIATKDGWADLHFKGVLDDESGFANLAAGFKYAVLSMPDCDSIVSLGVRYEIPTGSLETDGPKGSGIHVDIQGQGDGFIDVFATGATALGDLGVQANVGTNLAIDNDDSSMLHYSVHFDYGVVDRFYPMIDVNGYTTIDEGRRLGAINPDFEGSDLVNFGTTNSGTVVTMAWGGRIVITDNVMFGAAFELPLTNREDLIDWRVTTDLIVHM